MVNRADLVGIGEAASRTGVTPSALRFYEARGLLNSTERESGRRRYDETSLQRVRLLVMAQRSGFSLKEIRTLLDSYDSSRPVPAEWRALAERKLTELDGVIERTTAMQRLLRHALECGCHSLGDCKLMRAGAERRSR